MFQKKNNKGFTLAELLIVIAIIAALVAIMIPTFSGQVERAREAADLANLRAAYADATAKYLQDGTNPATANIVITQTKEGWDVDIEISSLPFTLNETTNEPKATDGYDTASFEFKEDGTKPVCTLSNSKPSPPSGG